MDDRPDESSSKVKEEGEEETYDDDEDDFEAEDEANESVSKTIDNASESKRDESKEEKDDDESSSESSDGDESSSGEEDEDEDGTVSEEERNTNVQDQDKIVDPIVHDVDEHKHEEEEEDGDIDEQKRAQEDEDVLTAVVRKDEEERDDNSQEETSLITATVRMDQTVSNIDDDDDDLSADGSDPDEEDADLTIEDRIQQDEALCARLQEEGDFATAMNIMEKSLVFRRNYFGPQAKEVTSACRILGEMCNLIAMSHLQKQNYDAASRLLGKAEVLSARNMPQRAVTLNNYACLYRRRGELRKAMSCLRKAIKIETTMQTEGLVVEKAADTHLNMCAVLSQLSEHAEALVHAKQALILMQEELYPLPHPDELPDDAPIDRVSVLCIAYYNSAVEQEFLKQFGRAQRSYLKGLDIAELYLGEDHSITKAYTGSLRNLAARLDSRHRQSTLRGSVQRGGLATKQSRARRVRGGELANTYGAKN